MILETVKPCEDGGNAFIIRLYESEGTQVRATVKFGFPVNDVVETNLLEEPIADAECGDDPIEVGSDACSLVFRPFGIRTLKVSY